ncbi:MAG: GNAT family N-acetyltransferase [Candidatus Promineifilaceae bacterium]
MFTIQKFEPTDDAYAAYVAIHNTIYAEMPIKVATRRHDDEELDAMYQRRRDFIMKDGVPIGYGEFGEAFWFGTDGGYFWMEICVYPEHEGQGAAAFWFADAEPRLRALGAKHIMAETLETTDNAIRMMTNRGFVQVMRNARSRIDLTETDFDTLYDPTEKLASERVVICSLRQLKGMYFDWTARALDISNAIGVDVPRSEEFRPIPLRDFKQWMAHPHNNDNAWFYAVDKTLDELVGVSTINFDPDSPEKVKVGATGVRRGYRRRGIARALKLATLRFAKLVGGQTINTDNEEKNPMYQLNLQLGFKPLPAGLEFKKTL